MLGRSSRKRASRVQLGFPRCARPNRGFVFLCASLVRNCFAKGYLVQSLYPYYSYALWSTRVHIVIIPLFAFATIARTGSPLLIIELWHTHGSLFHLVVLGFTV